MHPSLLFVDFVRGRHAVSLLLTWVLEPTFPVTALIGHVDYLRARRDTTSRRKAVLSARFLFAVHTGQMQTNYNRELSGSWTSFVDDVKGRFCGSPETAEAGCGDHPANAFFAGLRAQTQRDFLRTRTGGAQ